MFVFKIKNYERIVGICGTIAGAVNFKFHFMPSWIFWVCLAILIIRLLGISVTPSIEIEKIN